MSMTSKFMSRRAVLGGTLAAAALPLVAQGQDRGARRGASVYSMISTQKSIKALTLAGTC